MNPKVSIIIVSWNAAAVLRDCLMSIREAAKTLPLETLVIDNSSSDRSAEIVRQEFPEVTLLAQTENLGFARAVNIGFAASHGEYVFLLNPDATLNPDTLPTLLHYLETHLDVGIVGPRIMNADGSTQISTNRFPTFADQVIILTKFDHLWPNLAAIRRYTYADTPFAGPTNVDQVKGAAFLFHRSLLDRIGRFDEQFYLWFEEVDFCYRANAAGLHTAIIPSVSVRHHGGHSFHQRYSLDKHRIFLKSLHTYFRLHRPLWEQVAITPFLGISYLSHLLATPFHPR